MNFHFEIPQPLGSFWLQTLNCGDVGEEQFLCPGAWGMQRICPSFQSLSILKPDCLRYWSFYKTDLLIPFSTMPFACGRKPHCCTFNAGALISVAISCHYRILHQLVRDRAAKLFGVCHQPLHLGKTSASSGFLNLIGAHWCSSLHGSIFGAGT